MSEVNYAKLNQTAKEGTAIREMCQTEGFKVLRNHFEECLARLQKEWLTETDEKKLADIKKQALVWLEVKKALASLLIRGDNALRVIAEDKDQSI